MTATALYRSTIGKKAVMAGTGVILFGFVVVHMLGNLQVYLGRDKINDYSAFLKHTPSLLWGARVVLLTAVLLHIVTSIQLKGMQRRARPVGYRKLRAVEVGVGSRFMIFSGVALFGFIIYHLLHLTLGVIDRRFSETDVYQNLVNGFSVWWLSAIYIVSMLALGLHLRHGVWSMFQSLGVNNPRTDRLLRETATVLTGLVVVGNISIPIAVLIQVIK